MLVDGAHARHQLDLIQSEAVLRGITIHIVIDLDLDLDLYLVHVHVHVLEHFWQAVWAFHDTGDPAAEYWAAVPALTILAGGTRQVTESVERQDWAAQLTPTRRHGAEVCIRCPTGKESFLRYDRALEAGWPIATGVIEGACRHLIADRLDITGARYCNFTEKRQQVSRLSRRGPNLR